MKYLNIFISERFFFGLAYLREVRYSISHSISFFLILINLEVILKELLDLTNLAKA